MVPLLEEITGSLQAYLIKKGIESRGWRLARLNAIRLMEYGGEEPPWMKEPPWRKSLICVVQ